MNDNNIITFLKRPAVISIAGSIILGFGVQFTLWYLIIPGIVIVLTGVAVAAN